MNKGQRLIGGIILALLLMAGAATGAEERLVIGDFSAAPQPDKLPQDWSPLVFEKIPTHTNYRHVVVDGRGVIEAQSNGGSSGLVRKMKIDPAQYPVITWQWKVSNVLQKGDVTKKSGDDYPARIYITFSYDPAKVGFWEKVKFNAVKLFYGEYPPIAAINYIWANKAKPGLAVPNPYTERVRMIVVESGDEKAGQWLSERRNIVDDYRQAFHEEPPAISGIAIMTDTDNTGESATAWYGDIELLRQ